jgi:hypothetical protein
LYRCIENKWLKLRIASADIHITKQPSWTERRNIEMRNGKALTQKFDYDIGYLVKSPCRNCGTYAKFPNCMDRCMLLDRVQTALSDSLSSVHNFSAAESYCLPLEVLERI